MLTQAQAVAWIKESVGKSFDGDGKYGAQCKDYANAYSEFLGHPLLPSDAAETWSKTQNDFWQKIAYQEGVIPQPGDIVIWNATTKNTYGHIAVVIEATNLGLTSVDQNWNNSNATTGSAAEIIIHDYSNPPLLGFLRPRFDGTTPSNTVPKFILDQLESLANQGAQKATPVFNSSGTKFSEQEKAEACKNITENIANWPECLNKFSGRKRQAMIDEFVRKRNELIGTV